MNITGPFAAQVRPAERRWRQQRRPTSLWLSWAIFAVSQVFPKRPVNIGTIWLVSPSKSQFAETIWRHSLLMPPSKKTKNTLACVFTVANVLGTWERYHRPLLIYRLFSIIYLFYPKCWIGLSSLDQCMFSTCWELWMITSMCVLSAVIWATPNNTGK